MISVLRGDTRTPWTRADLWHLAWLLIASLVLRLAVVQQTRMISRDGLYYTDLALMINTEQWLSCVGDWFLFNPYPPLIALFVQLGAGYDLAGQLACAVPAALAVLPLFCWCRSAWNTRVAVAAGWLYVLHPVLLRTSGQVFREGVYWFLMLSATAVLWAALQRRGIGNLWRYALGGLLATGATLTRLEGAVLLLLPLTVWCMTPATDRNQAWQRRNGALLTLAMFPGLLIALNLALIPAGGGWRGVGRLTHFVQRFLPQKMSEAPAVMVAPAALPSVAVLDGPTPPTDIRTLADGLPIWNPEGLPALEQQRLRRFLILADDHRPAIYLAKFVSQCWGGLMGPVLAWMIFGIFRSRRAGWQRERDWPLMVQAGLLVAAMFYHLAAEQILEARYMFCLIPLVFPWAGVGIVETSAAFTRWLAAQDRAAWSRPGLAAACLLLAVAALGKGFHGLHSEKLPQRLVGERLKSPDERAIVIAGPESLKRIGHYADARYLILPQGEETPVRDWLEQQRVDYIVLAPEDEPSISPAALEAAPSARYERVLQNEPAFEEINIYRVLPPVRQLGS